MLILRQKSFQFCIPLLEDSTTRIAIPAGSSDGFNGSVVAMPNCGFDGLGGVCGLGGVTGFVPIGGGNGLPFMVSLGGEIFFPFSVLFTL